ncbi:MAG: secretin N-terminal domain-containing protein [Phycisphaerales bacterium]
MNSRTRIGWAGVLIGVAGTLGCATEPTATAPAERTWPAPTRVLQPGQSQREYDVALPMAPTQQRGRHAERVAPEDLTPKPGVTMAPAASAPADGQLLDVTLNFKQADPAEVFAAVFDRALKVNYVLAADLQSKPMSFVLEGRLSHDELLRTLDGVCEAYGWALVRSGDVMHVVNAAAAPKRPGEVRIGLERAADLIATGTYIIPLRSVSAKDLETTLTKLISERGALVTVPNTNVLVMVESPGNAERLLEIIREFDRPFFSNKSVRLYSPNYLRATELVKAFNEFALGMGAKGGEGGIYTVSALDRSQQVLVTTSVPELTRLFDAWFDRVDRPLDPDETRVHLYTPQHSSAATIQSAILAAFGTVTTEGDKPAVSVTVLEGGAGGSSSAAASLGLAPPAATSTTNQTNRTGSNNQSSTTQSPSGLGGFGASGGGSLGSSEPTRLMIMAKPAVYQQVRALIDLLDVAPKQVYLQVVVAEVVLSGDLQFGVELFTRQEVDGIPYELRSAANAVGSPIGSAFILSGNALALVNAAATDGNVRVISSPFTIATSGRSASLNVGSEVPIITQQITGSVDAQDPNRINQAIEYRKTGVILSVTPLVNDRGEVTMRIQQEVSNVVEPAAGAAIQSPSFSQRQIQTEVTVPTGDTAVMGGIRLERENSSVTKVPFLGDIPIVGIPFRSKNIFREQTELVILVTPTIMMDPGQLAGVTPHFLDGMVNLALIDDLLNKKIDTNEMLFR